MYENEQNEREILQWRLVHNWYQEQLWVQLTILTCPILNLDRRKTLQQLAQGLEEVLPSEININLQLLQLIKINKAD